MSWLNAGNILVYLWLVRLIGELSQIPVRSLAEQLEQHALHTPSLPPHSLVCYALLLLQHHGLNARATLGEGERRTR